MRLAALSTHPIQYQSPLWRCLAKTPELDIHVFFGSDFSVRGYRDKDFSTTFAWDVPLTDSYAHTFLSAAPEIQGPEQLDIHLLEFRNLVKGFQPDYALLNAYTPYRFYLKAFLVLKSLSIPILLRAEASDAALPRTRLREFTRDLLLKLFYRQIDKFLVIGQNAYRHYRSKGVPEKKLYWSPYSIDSDFFESQRQKWLPERSAIRRSLGFSENQFVFIFSGKLIPLKDSLTIAKAFKRMDRESLSKIGFLVVGDGPMRDSLHEELNPVSEIRSHFAGFQNQSELGRYYSAADCLILPSLTETWGLVVNEALQFGIPAIVSDKVGCHPDLIVEGKTGFVFPAGDDQRLADQLSKVFQLVRSNPNLVKEACQQKANDYSMHESVAGLQKALFSPE